jgi:hypothetical protein
VKWKEIIDDFFKKVKFIDESEGDLIFRKMMYLFLLKY